MTAAAPRAHARRALLCTQVAWALTMIATWAYTVAVAVYAFRAGGAAAVGLAVGLRTLPSALAGPLVGAVADRARRSAVMASAAATAALAVAASAAGAAGLLPPGAVYGLGLAVIVAGMAFRTAMTAELPVLAGGAGLVSANVTAGTIESTGVFAGPALAAILLAAGGPVAALAGAGLLFAAAVPLAAAGTHGPSRAAPREGAVGGAATADRETVAVVAGLLFVQTIASGALTVILVVCAADLGGFGPSGAGVLTAAYGAGGLLGAAAARLLRGRVGLLTAGIVLWAVPLAVLGLTSRIEGALLLLAVAGAGNVLFDVATVTALQRAVPDRIRARALGLVETIVAAGLGLGSLAAPLLVAAIGLPSALAASGMLLPAGALACRLAISCRSAAARWSRPPRCARTPTACGRCCACATPPSSR